LNRIDVSPDETLLMKLKGPAAVEWSLCSGERSAAEGNKVLPTANEAGNSDFLVVAKDVGYWAEGEVRGKWLEKLTNKMAERVSVNRGVSVVIPSGDVHRLKTLLGSLESSLDLDAVEVIAVFNSLDQVGKVRKELGGFSFGVRVYVWDKPFSFGGIGNYGASKSLAPYVLFLRDDCFPRKGFLSALLEPIECDPLVGVVGAKLLFPDDKIQHLGISFKGEATGQQLYEAYPFRGKKEVEVSQAGEDRVVPAVSGVCMLIRREVFVNLGGFDEKEYEFGFYEDFDLCLRAKRDFGLKTVCSGRSEVRKDKPFVFVDGKEEGYYQANRIKFKDRWDSVLEDTLYVFEEDRFRHREERAVVLNSYLDTAGGGERTCCGLAKMLSQRYRVLLETKGEKGEEGAILKRKLETVLGYDLFGVDMVKFGSVDEPEVFVNHEWSSSEQGQGEKNIYFTMFPHTGDKWFLDSYDVVVANSKFTAGWVKGLWERDAKVIYPPVRLVRPSPKKKENIILSVGRFFEGVGSKRQDVLLDVWKEIGQELGGWRLVLVGGYREDKENEREYLQMLYSKIIKEQIESVEVCFNVSRAELESWYWQAKIFWHAAGYEAECPDGMEHFGIATTEALSASAFPIVYRGGGQEELINDVREGQLWTTKEELVEYTRWVMREEKWNFDCRARVDELYGEERFERQIWELLEG